MNKKIKRIEILDQKTFNQFIEKNECDKFFCSAEKYDENNVVIRMGILSNKDLFDEFAELLSCIDLDFAMFGGTVNKKNSYVLLELF